MRLVKKYLMMVIKFIIGLFPKGLRNLFKRSPYLSALYSRSLQKSGLFYGFPSRKELDKTYQLNLKYQHDEVHLLKASYIDYSILVNCSNYDENSLALSLKSVNQLENKPSLITFWVSPKTQKQIEIVLNTLLLTSVKYEVLTGLDESEICTESTSVLCINCGDFVHNAITSVLASKINHYDVVYVDTDIMNDDMFRHSPAFYPDWNTYLQLTTAYLQTGLLINSPKGLNLLLELPLSRISFSELMIKVALSNDSFNIQHSPFTLISQRVRIKNVFNYVSTETMSLIREQAKVKISNDKSILSLLPFYEGKPLVSLIIPTKNGLDLVKACIDSILTKTDYDNYEIILVDNNSDDPACLTYFSELNKHTKISVIEYPHPFNYSAINNFAIQYAKGSIIGLINNDIEVISSSWLDYMVAYVSQPNVGCVGAKLLYGDGRIQHAGVVLGYGGGAGHAHKYFPEYHSGYLNRLAATNEFSAVTAACLLVKKSDFEAVNGLNEIDLKVAFNDVDFCLKVLELDRVNVFCAESILFHHESVSRGYDDTKEKQIRSSNELSYLVSNWGEYIKNDPAYNINLTLKRENFSIKLTQEYDYND